MKKIFLSVFLVLSLNAQNLEIDKIRTDLYSKSGANVLKKVEISLEFDGNNVGGKIKFPFGKIKLP